MFLDEDFDVPRSENLKYYSYPPNYNSNDLLSKMPINRYTYSNLNNLGITYFSFLRNLNININNNLHLFKKVPDSDPIIGPLCLLLIKLDKIIIGTAYDHLFVEEQDEFFFFNYSKAPKGVGIPSFKTRFFIHDFHKLHKKILKNLKKNLKKK